MKNIIYDIKSEANNLRQKSDEELKGKMLQLKKRAKTENLNNLLVECFALVQEVSSGNEPINYGIDVSANRPFPRITRDRVFMANLIQRTSPPVAWNCLSALCQAT